MRGLKWLFLMRPPALGDVERWVFPLLDEAVKAGVERIVFLSVVGAETRAYLPHAKVEARLAPLAQRTALTVGILRPGFFVQNLLSAYREDSKHGITRVGNLDRAPRNTDGPGYRALP